MIKWIVALITVVVILGMLIIFLPPESPQLSPNPTASPTAGNSRDYFLSPLIAKNLILVDNTTGQLPFRQLYTDYGCQKAINGGFYQQDKKPLGWMVIEGKQVQKIKTSGLFNGFIFIKEGRMYISKIADEKARFGHQSGPVLIENYKTVNLKIINDKPARRSVMALDDDNNPYMIMIFSPLMIDLSEKILEIGKTENINFKSAINLDGGSASAYDDGVNKISEFSPVGSVWCEK